MSAPRLLLKNFDTKTGYDACRARGVAKIVEHFSSRGFDDIVLSAKAHDVPAARSIRALSKSFRDSLRKAFWSWREAGTVRRILLPQLAFSRAALVMRLSLTEDRPCRRVHSMGASLTLVMRRIKPELSSCPVRQVQQHDSCRKGYKRLRMAFVLNFCGSHVCVVNGPGEARALTAPVAKPGCVV